VPENEHRAGTNSQKTKKFLITGIFGAVCSRHEMVLKFFDMVTKGEPLVSYKYTLILYWLFYILMYSLDVIHQLLDGSGSDGKDPETCPEINIMYDIACKLRASLQVCLGTLIRLYIYISYCF
jgi:hypothetical protein